MIHAEDNKIINPSEFASIVEPGMVLEISIVLRQNATFEEHEEKCPRCGHVNLNMKALDGWIERKVTLYFYPCHLFTSCIVAVIVLDSFKLPKVVKRESEEAV